MSEVNIEMNWSAGASLTTAISLPAFGVNAQQVLVVHAEVGTLTLTLDSIATDPIPFNASAAQTQAILEAHPSIGAGNVVVQGLPLTTGPQLITFVEDLAEQPISRLLVNASGLSGDDAAAQTAVLTQGWAAEDDYGSPDEIVVTVFDNFFAERTVSNIFYYSGMDIFLSLSTISPGGDDQASWNFTLFPPYDDLFPLVGQQVLISDKKGVFWVGRISSLSVDLTVDKADFTVTSRGYFTQVDDKIQLQSLYFTAGEQIWNAFVSTLYTLGLPSGGVYYDADLIEEYDKVFTDDSTDQYGKTATQIWSELAGFGNAYGEQVTYHIRPKLPDDPGFSWGGLPIFELKSRPLTPKYVVRLQDGLQLKMGWDIDEIVNEYILRFGDQNTFSQGLAVVRGSSVNGIYRQQYIQNSNSLTSSDAAAYGLQLLARHGRFVSKGDSFTVPGGMVILDVDGRYVPPWRARAGFMLDVPDLPSGFSPTDFFATSVKWEQHTNAVTFSTGVLNDLAAALHKAVQNETKKTRREDAPVNRGVSRGPAEQNVGTAKPDKEKPSNIAPGSGFSPAAQNPQLPLTVFPSAVINSTINYVLPTSDTQGVLEVDFDCIIKRVTIYAPADETGSASVIVGHSTYDAYPTITDLATLSVSGMGGKARSPNIEQQLFAGDVVYFAFPSSSPATGYTRVTVALSVQKAYVGS